jgi:hypothetical protein
MRTPALPPEDPEMARNLRRAAEETGRSVEDILQDHARQASAPGGLELWEYLINGLHVPSRHTDAEREDFISTRLHWPIVKRCCDTSLIGVVDDKWLCQKVLSASGLPVPETVAVFDRSCRIYPGTRILRTSADMTSFLASRGGRSFFAKPIRGIGADGAILCESPDGTGVHVRGHGPMTAEAFFEALGTTPHLFQEVLVNHPKIHAFAPHLATVRLNVLVYDDMVTMAHAVLKVPGAGNVVDSPLRDGNLVCHVADPEGEIRTIVTSTPTGRMDHAAHPETGAPMLGIALPFWNEVRQVAAAGALLFAPLRLQSLDIAITARGPVIVEINAGGSTGMVQRATLRGFLQPNVRHFLKACGVDLEELGREVDADLTRRHGPGR